LLGQAEQFGIRVPVGFLYSPTGLTHLPLILNRCHLSRALRIEYKTQLACSNSVLYAKHLGPGYLYHWAANQCSVPIPNRYEVMRPSRVWARARYDSPSMAMLPQHQVSLRLPCRLPPLGVQVVAITRYSVLGVDTGKYALIRTYRCEASSDHLRLEPLQQPYNLLNRVQRRHQQETWTLHPKHRNNVARREARSTTVLLRDTSLLSK
jgi:hypothetical protein